MKEWPALNEVLAVAASALAGRMLGLQPQALPPMREIARVLPIQMVMTVAMGFLAFAITRVLNLHDWEQVLAVAFIVRGGPPLIEGFAARLFYPPPTRRRP